MEIHVVHSGESLWTIANAYGVTAESIIDTNQIQDLPYLIPGMALIIPTRESAPFGRIEVNAYIEPSGAGRDAQVLSETGEYLTYIAPFSYQVVEDGSLIAPRDSLVLQEAESYGIVPLMVVTNFREGNFDAQLIHGILNNTDIQDTLIQNVLEVLGDKGYYGVNLDLERIPPEDRENYNNFLRRVVDALHPQGYVVSTALAPMPYDITEGEWHGAHDYEAHGRIVDFVVLMTYEYGWSGGPPMAVAPVNEVRRVIEYATSVMPPEKIMMGIPLYGYDWALPYVPGGDWAGSISPQQALELAAGYGATIQYDNVAQSPYFYYWQNGEEHVVWFEDARSIRAKLLLADEFNIRGISYWVLGFNFPQNWVVLDDMFIVEKLG